MDVSSVEVGGLEHRAELVKVDGVRPVLVVLLEHLLDLVVVVPARRQRLEQLLLLQQTVAVGVVEHEDALNLSQLRRTELLLRDRFFLLGRVHPQHELLDLRGARELVIRLRVRD